MVLGLGRWLMVVKRVLGLFLLLSMYYNCRVMPLVACFLKFWDKRNIIVFTKRVHDLTSYNLRQPTTVTYSCGLMQFKE